MESTKINQFNLIREDIAAALKYSGAMKPSSFAEFYATILFRTVPRTIFEIGIHKGGSIRLWRKLFGEEVRIVALDIRKEACDLACGVADDVYCGSQVNLHTLDKIAEECGPFDIIVDDGSHLNKHMITTCKHLFRHVNPKGVYVVEDMFTSFWPSYEGGFLHKDTFIEFAIELSRLQYRDYISDKYAKQFKGTTIPQIRPFPEFSGLKQVDFNSDGIVALLK
jgi:hypothetical protein